MSELKATPGPWTYEVHELSEGYSAIVYDAKGVRVGTDHMSEADARLISAAPDLYGALQFILAFYEPGQRYLDTEAWKVAMASAQHAMRKARGETP